MTRVLAIDPGNTQSGWVVTDADTHKPLHFGKTDNHTLIDYLRVGHPLDDVRYVAVEMVASYGMAVGADVFETCVWIGKYAEVLRDRTPELVYRREVKLHHCGQTRAKDANITQALVDRFALGQPNRGKGTKANPGWFYGFRADIWQAYALAVYVADSAAVDEETA